MKQKILLILEIFAALALLAGIPSLIYEIQAHGVLGANWGRVLCPLIVSGFLRRKRKTSETE